MTEPQESTAPETGAVRRSRALVAIRVGGGLIAVAAVALCAKALSDEWHTVSHAVAHANVGLLVIALITSALAMVGLGLLWWRCLSVFGVHVTRREAIAWYLAGELGKYVPGGVWAVLGRGELARRSGRINRGDTYATTLVGYGSMCLGAAVVCGILAPFLAVYGDHFGWAWIMLALIPIGVIVVHPAVLGRLLTAARKASKGRVNLQAPPWKRMLELILWAVPTWALVGLSSVLVAQSFGFSERPARIAFAAIAAWIIGFLAVPVPAGAGLRELIFSAICGLASAPAVAVAAGARVLLIVADAVGGGIGLLYARHRASAAVARHSATDIQPTTLNDSTVVKG